ncbi:hypothetical protein GGF32_001263 [Allomyces javanicus]|nr:hypothetical protein GGF32_001263 [Allomyces javanicus]
MSSPSTLKMTVTDRALAAHAGGWTRLSRTNTFMAQLRADTLPSATFTKWLAQDYLFVVDFTKFMGHLFALAPRRDVDLLLSGFAAVRAEVAWFEQHLAKTQPGALPGTNYVRLTDSNAASTGAGMACVAFVSWLQSLEREHAPEYRRLLIVFWAMEHAYMSAWNMARGDLHVPARYQEFVDRWTVPEFAAYVEGLKKAVDTAYSTATELDIQDAVNLVGKVVEHEEAFWAMVLAA